MSRKECLGWALGLASAATLALSLGVAAQAPTNQGGNAPAEAQRPSSEQCQQVRTQAQQLRQQSQQDREAYRQAVQEYGKDSQQAREAYRQLHRDREQLKRAEQAVGRCRGRREGQTQTGREDGRGQQTGRGREGRRR